MKAVISNKIYLSDSGRIRTNEIISQLTYKFKKDTGSKHFSTVETVRNYKLLPNGILAIPQGRTDLIPADYEIVDKRVYDPVPFPNTKFELRPEQQEVYETVTDTCFINALVGWGKCFALSLSN